MARPAGRSFGGVGGIGGVGVPGPDDGGGITGPFESFGPGGPPGPTALATFSRGRATLVLSDGSPIVLDRISPGPHLFSEFGSNVRWSNADGWYLTVAGAGAVPGAGGAGAVGDAYVQLDRIQDHVHLTSDDPSLCHVVIQVADVSGLRGTASCSGLRWVDALGGSGFVGPPSAVPGEGPFDAQISFEATP
ncbi:MAG: hypothetical protein M3067_12140 [Chloroflexota bacterium]|nr:hypothetical protein [Chloroflexota bacterium]